jgi:hypothetical protein
MPQFTISSCQSILCEKHASVSQCISKGTDSLVGALPLLKDGALALLHDGNYITSSYGVTRT